MWRGALDERAKLPEREPKARQIGRCGHGRRTRSTVDQSDLAEMVTALQRPNCGAPVRDRRFAGLDEVDLRAA